MWGPCGDGKCCDFFPNSLFLVLSVFHIIVFYLISVRGRFITKNIKVN